MEINEILEQREKTHGDYTTVAKIAQTLKKVISWYVYGEYNQLKISESQKEALDMICSKIARICNGDANKPEHWEDVAGYAMLIIRELEKQEKEKDEADDNEKEDNETEFFFG